MPRKFFPNLIQRHVSGKRFSTVLQDTHRRVHIFNHLLLRYKNSISQAYTTIMWRVFFILLIVAAFLSGYSIRNPQAPSYSTSAIAMPSAIREESVVVTRVLDGDTVELADGRRVRYEGIDAPESQQEFSTESRDLNARLVEGKTVRLEIEGEEFDVYGRTLAFVWLPDDRMVNEQMVREGYAEVIAFGGIPSAHHDVLMAAQKEAQQNFRGMWYGELVQ